MTPFTKNWTFWTWIVVIGLGAVLEGFGLRLNRDWTFTHLVRTYVPVPIRAGVLGWLGYHFIIQK